MCMAFTRHSPSRTPLSFKASSTSGVMFRYALLSGVSNQSSFRCDFMVVARIVSRLIALPGMDATLPPTEEVIMPRKILVTGATGKVASQVVPSLTKLGHTVRALVRDPAKAGTLNDAGVELVP